MLRVKNLLNDHLSASMELQEAMVSRKCRNLQFFHNCGAKWEKMRRPLHEENIAETPGDVADLRFAGYTIFMESLPFGRGKGFTQTRVDSLNPLQLAFIGDAVYSLYARTSILEGHDGNVRSLSGLTNLQVCAAAQAKAFEELLGSLSEEERGILRRGKNARPHSIPRNADKRDYQRATAIEALIGYLYLTGRDERVSEIMERILSGSRNGEIE